MHLLNEPHSSYSAASTDALHDFAPGLERNLVQLFNKKPQSLSSIREIFNYSFAHGGREDPHIPRRIDESYNPRCARLSQILISEIETVDEVKIKVAMLTPLPPDATGEGTLVPKLIATYASQIANYREINFDNNLAGIEDVLLADWIDLVRHLHLSSRDRTELQTVIAKAHKLLDQISEFNPHKRLMTILAHTISQQERRCIA